MLESLEHGIGAVREQMSVALAHHHFSPTRDRRDDLAALHRQDLVVVSVEQEQGSTEQTTRHLASGRLRGERDDTTHLVHHHANAHSNCTTERMPHDHHSTSTSIGGHLHGGGNVEATGIEIVRLAIVDAQHGNTTFGPGITESLVKTVGWPEESTHRTSARDDGRGPHRCRRNVPEHRHQSAHREELQVPKIRRDHGVL